MKYILMLCIGLIWGSQFLLNDIILKSFSPLGLAALRMFFGFITLSVLIFILPKERKKKVNLDKKLLILFIALGATDAAIPFYLIGYGQTQLDSAVVAKHSTKAASTAWESSSSPLADSKNPLACAKQIAHLFELKTGIAPISETYGPKKLAPFWKIASAPYGPVISCASMGSGSGSPLRTCRLDALSSFS